MTAIPSPEHWTIYLTSTPDELLRIREALPRALPAGDFTVLEFEDAFIWEMALRSPAGLDAEGARVWVDDVYARVRTLAGLPPAAPLIEFMARHSVDFADLSTTPTKVPSGRCYTMPSKR